MSAEGKGGAAVWIWVLVGLVVGVGAGWWYSELSSYTLFGGLGGWFVGLSLAHLEGSEAH